LAEVENMNPQIFKRYLSLTETQRKVVRDVVGEFTTTGVV
jgi:hypothetical protein